MYIYLRGNHYNRERAILYMYIYPQGNTNELYMYIYPQGNTNKLYMYIYPQGNTNELYICTYIHKGTLTSYICTYIHKGTLCHLESEPFPSIKFKYIDLPQLYESEMNSWTSSVSDLHE